MEKYKNTSSLDELIKTSLDRVKSLMEINTIIGEPLRIEETTTIIPISKASVGFVVGGGEYSDKSNRRVANHFPMAGGSGCGMTISPVGFIVIRENNTEFVDIENKTMYQTLLNLANKIIDKIKTNNNEDNDEKSI